MGILLSMSILKPLHTWLWFSLQRCRDLWKEKLGFLRFFTRVVYSIRTLVAIAPLFNPMIDVASRIEDSLGSILRRRAECSAHAFGPILAARQNASVSVTTTATIGGWGAGIIRRRRS